MKIYKQAGWIRKKIKAAITELGAAIEESKKNIELLKARMRLNIEVPFQNMENTPEAQQVEGNMQKIYVFQVTIGSLQKLLELIADCDETEKLEVDTGDDKAWLMSTVDSDAE